MNKYFFLLVIAVLCFSCKNNESSDNSTSTDTNNENAASFAHSVEYEYEITEASIFPKITDYQSDNDCSSCSMEKECYDKTLLGSKVFKEGGEERMMAIIGRSCDEAAHAESGWCDVALFTRKNGAWSLDKFLKEVGGGSPTGQTGMLGEFFPIGENAIGFEVGFGDMAQGQSFEGVDFLVYQDNNVFSVGMLQTYMDNLGSAFDESDMMCLCQDYEFVPTSDGNLYDLKISQKDCKSWKGEGCGGELGKETTIKFDGKAYVIPSEFQIF